MGALSTDPFVRRRQFQTRKTVALFTLGALVVVLCLNTISNVVFQSSRSHNRVRRQAAEGESEGDTSADSTEPKTSICDDEQFVTKYLSPAITQVNNISTEDFNEFKINFYNQYYNNICEEASVADTFEGYSNDTIDAAVACGGDGDISLKKLYGKEYQTNGIYWCDSPAGLPGDLFNVQQRQNGAIVLYFIGMVYMFYALAIVCDEYFVPALEVITDKLSLSPDVAGATFMAAGGSAPELFTSIIGVFLTQSSVGIGTIVGSAVFNILFVLGACAFVVGSITDEKTGKPTVLNLTWFPLTRDTVFYIVALLAVIVSFKTGSAKVNEQYASSIEMWEGIYMFLIYIAYVTFMMFNAKIEQKFSKAPPVEEEEMDALSPKVETVERKEAKSAWTRAVSKVPTTSTFHSRQVLALTTTMNAKKDDQLAAYAVARFYALKKRVPGEQNSWDAKKCEVADKDVVPEGDVEGSPYDMDWPSSEDSFLRKILKIVTYPLAIPMKFTIPDVRYTSVKNLCGGNIFIVSFTMSIVWIIVFSYLMVWWATRIGETYNIDAAIMGLTFLAAGTSVPDLITSIIVAKEGHGDMAVSSSIGSNIFDVTVGLPVPWLLSTIIFAKPVVVSSEGLGCSIGLLLLMLVTLIVSIVATGWKMNRVMGGLMLGLYVGFVAVSLLLEYKVFTCPF